MRDQVALFDQLLKKRGISRTKLAQLTGRSIQNLSQFCNKKRSVPLDTFELYIQKADELSPGFEDDFYTALAGKQFEVQTWVENLSMAEVSVLLHLCSKKVAQMKPAQPRQDKQSQPSPTSDIDQRELIPA